MDYLVLVDIRQPHNLIKSQVQKSNQPKLLAQILLIWYWQKLQPQLILMLNVKILPTKLLAQNPPCNFMNFLSNQTKAKATQRKRKGQQIATYPPGHQGPIELQQKGVEELCWELIQVSRAWVWDKNNRWQGIFGPWAWVHPCLWLAICAMCLPIRKQSALRLLSFLVTSPLLINDSSSTKIYITSI